MTGDENKRSSCRSIIREFSLNTSVHGIPGIARSQSIHNRMFWSTSLIFFTTVMTIFVVQAIIDYFEYPTNIDVKIVSESVQSFPAVSLCNASPFVQERYIGAFLDYMESLNLTNRTNTTTFSPEEVIYMRNFITDKLNRNESIEDFFYPLSSMLYICLLNGRKCSEADFIPFKSANYGQCYTLNAKLKHRKNNNASNDNQDTVNTVLYLGLYLHSHQYLSYSERGE